MYNLACPAPPVHYQHTLETPGSNVMYSRMPWHEAGLGSTLRVWTFLNYPPMSGKALAPAPSAPAT